MKIIIILFTAIIALFSLTNCEKKNTNKSEYRYEIDLDTSYCHCSLVTILDSNNAIKKFNDVNPDWSYSFKGNGDVYRKLRITATNYDGVYGGPVTVYVYKNNNIAFKNTGTYDGVATTVTIEGSW